MRKVSTRSILVILLVIASISSYTFLSVVAEPADTEPTVIEAEVTSPEQGELILPDVQLVKKILEIGHKISSFTR